MTFGEEIVQLLFIIIALLMILMGINFWTKRGGGITLPSMRTKPSQNANTEGNINMDEDGTIPGTETGARSNSAKPRAGSVADRHGDRFNLTGKDAEAAARVLKRMLKKDESN